MDLLNTADGIRSMWGGDVCENCLYISYMKVYLFFPILYVGIMQKISGLTKSYLEVEKNHCVYYCIFVYLS